MKNKLRLFLAATVLICLPVAASSQNMTKPRIKIHSLRKDFPIDDINNSAWKNAAEINVKTNWDGTAVAKGRRLDVWMLWSDLGLYVRFDAAQAEPLIVSSKPELSKKTMRLWDRDVCELFLAPDPKEPRRYVELEIAPTGEWLDLMVDWRNGEPRDWEYLSRMEPFAHIDPGKVTMVMKIPWAAFGGKPNAGDVWLGNLFRQVGSGETRGYLAWSPTLTKEPQFHVPEKFGEFVFVK